MFFVLPFRANRRIPSAAALFLYPGHNLRHLFAVEHYKADRDLDALRLDMGHSLLATTQRYLKETVEKHYERVMKRRTPVAE